MKVKFPAESSGFSYQDYNQRPDDRLLLKLSRLIGDWWPLAKLLGVVSDAAIEQIEVQHRDPQRRCYNVLTKWRKDNHAKPTGSVQYLHEQCQEAEIDPQTIADVFGCPLKEDRKESVDRTLAELKETVEDLKRLIRYLLPPDLEESSMTSTNRLTCSHTNLPMNRCDEVSSPKCHLSNQNIPESNNGAQFPQDRMNQHCQVEVDITGATSAVEIPCMNSINTKLIVAAIDFGTTYSGWAFSFEHDYYRDPTKIRMRQWRGGEIVSYKAPTTVLIQPDGKTLEAFGYKAETKYAELASQINSSEYKRWYFFRRFKMLLHGKMRFDRHVHLEDETKKILPAKTVFSLVIKYLMEDMEDMLKKNIRGLDIKKDEITWVLTVPAIWNDAAKQFMREAAVEAGIGSENLKIVLEPEAASIFCRLLPVEEMIDGIEMAFFTTGSKYLVLDAGGGTVDITVHKVTPDGNLRELHKASGGAWGGTNVDVAFEEFIISIVGKVVFQRFQSEYKEDYIDMFRAFEIQKRDVAPDSNRKYKFPLPSSLIHIFEDETNNDLRYVITQSRYAGKLVLARNRLFVDASLMQGLFTKTIQSIVSHLKEMMKDSNILGISNILMVGGFSESKMLQSAIKFNFPGFRIVVPCEPELMVLKGAVVFGHSPLAVAQRVYKYTYGVKTTVTFDAKIHDEWRLRKDTDELVCDDIFSKYIEKGQTISLNETTEELYYVPLYEEQMQAVIDIYASNQKSPMYVTDEGCFKVGSFIVDIQDNSVPSHERFIHVSLTFRGTEIEAKAREERTGKTTKIRVDFLE